MTDQLDIECDHCRSRLAALERLAESNARIEKILERVLEFVTPKK